MQTLRAELACRMEVLRGQLPSTDDTTALIDLRGGITTYRWLHDRAALLAAALQRHTSGPGAVGVLCERSAMQVAGMLATWRTGLIYLPLDPILPPQRLLWMLSDAQPVALLVGDSSGSATDSVAKGYEGPTLLLESGVLLRSGDAGCMGGGGVGGGVGGGGGGVGSGSEPHVSRAAVPADGCYLLYSSGSTGEPKGVSVRARGRP
jgi:non-ribosomal peptide synthetase component F